MAMKDEQGNQDDEVYENTLLEHYDHVRIDQEVIEAELQGERGVPTETGPGILSPSCQADNT